MREELEGLDPADFVNGSMPGPGHMGPRERAELIVSQHDAIQRGVQHLNNQSIAIRAVASAWMLGTLGGAGWILRETGSLESSLREISNPVIGIVALILLTGAVGLLLLWLLDRHFNYRLLDSVFIVGIALELGHPNLLAPVSRLMGQATASRLVHAYYLVPAGGFVGAGWLATVQLDGSGWKTAAIVLACVVALLWISACAHSLSPRSSAIQGVIARWNLLAHDIRRRSEPCSEGATASPSVPDGE